MMVAQHAPGLDVGDRTVMLHQGQVVLDVSGEERKRLDVPDLLQMFEGARRKAGRRRVAAGLTAASRHQDATELIAAGAYWISASSYFCS